MSPHAHGAELDAALLNGTVYPVVGVESGATAIGVRGGKVAAIGSDADVRAQSGSSTRIVELAGRAVVPAFIESHTHFHRGAVLRHLYLDFDALRPPDVAGVLERVRSRAAQRPHGEWIQGDGLSALRLAEGRLPDRRELDAAAPDHPVLLRGIGKHVVAANSAALTAAGIDAGTPDPPGGRIERDPDGRPNGILHERAKLRLEASAADTVVPAPSQEDRLAGLRQGITELQRLGIGTIHEMVRQPEEAADLALLNARGELGVRVRLYYRVHESPLSLDWLVQLGIRRGLGDDRFRVAGVKISIDGFCIFANAAVYEPYREQPDNCGLLRIEPERLNELVAGANRHGLQVAVHAVGPRAADLALTAFERAGPATAGPYRLEHAYLDMTEERLDRIRALGVAWSTQPGFLEAYRAEWASLFDAERIGTFMPLRRAADLGIPLLLNSDFPCSPVDPRAGLRAATSLGAERALSLGEAWRGFTSEPARVAGEPCSGRLDVGSPADLLVLRRDPFRAADAAEAEIAGTMIGGEFVFLSEGGPS